MNRLRLLAILALSAGLSRADIVLPGYTSVHRDVCYEFATGLPLFVVVRQVSGSTPWRYVPLDSSGQCVDQGYKFNMASIWRDLRGEGSTEMMDSTVDPATVSWLKPVTLLDSGLVSSNWVQYPESLGVVSERWTYAILGNWAAVVTQVQSTLVDGQAMASVLNIDYLWPEDAFITRVAPRSTTTAGLGVISSKGSRVELTLDRGVADLSVVSTSGRLLRRMRVSATAGRVGWVDLGMTPPPGSFLDLRQGSRRSVRIVPRR